MLNLSNISDYQCRFNRNNKHSLPKKTPRGLKALRISIIYPGRRYIAETDHTESIRRVLKLPLVGARDKKASLRAQFPLLPIG